MSLFENNPDIVIMTRHKATEDWLAKQGITGKVIRHANSYDDFAGKIIVGNVPLWIAAKSNYVAVVQFNYATPSNRGETMTLEQMENSGACLATYVVKRVYGIINNIAIPPIP